MMTVTNKKMPTSQDVLPYGDDVESILHDLGPVGLARYWELTGNGSGDYTREKYECSPLSFDEIFRLMDCAPQAANASME